MMRLCSEITAESGGGPISPSAAASFKLSPVPGYGVAVPLFPSSPGIDLDKLDLGRMCSETATPGVAERS